MTSSSDETQQPDQEGNTAEHVGDNEKLMYWDAIARRELKRWGETACEGEIQKLAACTDTVLAACPERDHRMCPRHKAARLEEELREHRHALRRRLREQGVRELTLTAVFDQPNLDTDAVRKVRSAFTSVPRPTIVILQGGVGCGKSCAAALWAIGNGAHWISAKKLSRMGYESELDRLGECPLVIDDLGSEFVDEKGFFLSTLDGIVDDHISNKIDLLLTTNVASDDFKKRYGARIASRIRESGRFARVEGDDMRRRR